MSTWTEYVWLWTTLKHSSGVGGTWQTEVTTVVCDRKQLKKLVDLSRNLDTVKRVVYMEDDGNNLEPSLSGSSSKWTVASFSHVQSLGRQLPANPDMPLAADIAVIMYTSGSTGLPKVKSPVLVCHSYTANGWCDPSSSCCQIFFMIRKLADHFRVVLLLHEGITGGDDVSREHGGDHSWCDNNGSWLGKQGCVSCLLTPGACS